MYDFFLQYFKPNDEKKNSNVRSTSIFSKIGEVNNRQLSLVLMLRVKNLCFFIECSCYLVLWKMRGFNFLSCFSPPCFYLGVNADKAKQL